MTRSDYEERQARKKERLLQRKEKAERESAAARQAAERLSSAIPFGQPILVGHHSEKRHRRDLDRIHGNMGKAIEKAAEAKQLALRAEAVGTGGISSDDPEAVVKLSEKLQRLEERQDWMKRVNAAWRAAREPLPNDTEAWRRIAEALVVEAESLNDLRMEMARRWQFQPGAPFLSYTISGGTAEMRRVRQRIDELRRATRATSSRVDHGVLELVENVEENRIQLIFPGKPDEATRALLKQWGFRWSPTASAWQRHLNDAGRMAAGVVVEKLSKSATPPSRGVS